MPVIIREAGYRFFFYSDEGNPREPVHIHVRGNGHEVKFWLDERLTVARNDGFDTRTIRFLAEIIERNRTTIEEAWNGHFR
ncbi:DUF4160 domain-containing protein [Pararhodospirillum oryzae]|uniref:DUF4160 domain-containing protein n=1 Tax=Pararhodospirillum oryzae TaxID=478448 RepID=A0A512HB29_9PROT|nr:DUF4160 domain-containing protein [Pararhodospirillum oryzae]GEO82590.1 hypothetical protein ROR02_27210 [Pararhodospirillum oryzae]